MYKYLFKKKQQRICARTSRKTRCATTLSQKKSSEIKKRKKKIHNEIINPVINRSKMAVS